MGGGGGGGGGEFFSVTVTRGNFAAEKEMKKGEK